jgi:hypothetical protein
MILLRPPDNQHKNNIILLLYKHGASPLYNVGFVSLLFLLELGAGQVIIHRMAYTEFFWEA